MTINPSNSYGGSGDIPCMPSATLPDPNRNGTRP